MKRKSATLALRRRYLAQYLLHMLLGLVGDKICPIWLRSICLDDPATDLNCKKLKVEEALLAYLNGDLTIEEVESLIEKTPTIRHSSSGKDEAIDIKPQ